MLDVTVSEPLSVEVTPMLAVIVPPIWPEQFGCVWMPPGLTEIVEAREEPESVPVRKPFRRTVPLLRPSKTGPVTEPLA